MPQELKNVNLNLRDLKDVKCQGCGSTHFIQVWVLKFVPKLMIGAQEDQLVSIQVWNCNMCNRVLSDTDFKHFAAPNQISLLP